MSILLTTLSAVLFYALPTLIGRGILKLLYKKDLIYPWVSYFVVGALALYLTTVTAFYALTLFIPEFSFLPILYGTTGLLAFIFIPANILASRTDLGNWRKYIKPAALSLTLTSLTYTIWHMNSPYPFNWDMFEHQLLANEILEGNFSFFTSSISDTFGFNGYSTFFHTSLAVSQLIIRPAEIFTYFHALSIIHATLVALASFVLAKELTDRKEIAYLTLIFTALTFDSSVSYSTLFIIPQTFTASIWVLLLAQLISTVKKGQKFPLFLLGISILFILLNHYIIGTIAAGLYIALFFYLKYKQQIHTRLSMTYAVQIVILLSIVAVLLSPTLALDSLNHGEAIDYTLSTLQKFDVSRQVYGILFLLLLPIGAVDIIRKKGEMPLLTLTTGLLLLALILMQVPYVLKFYVLARPFVHIIFAIGILALIKKVHSSVMRAVAIGALICVLLITLVTNAASWKELLRYNDTFTNVSLNEMKAAEFLKREYGDTDTLLVSDPATQHIFEMLSGINTQGGAYMNHDTRDSLEKIEQSKDPESVANILYQIEDKLEVTSGKRILVTSGRYFLWQQSTEKNKDALSYNIWYPADLTLENELIVDRYKKNDRFNLVYKNGTLAIFEIEGD